MSKEKKEIEEHLKIALKEIGEIKPWFDKNFQTWIFYHDLYPVEYSGDSKEEVISNYPLYLKEFIKHRLQEKLAPIMKKKTNGRGGERIGAGRPRKSESEEEQKVRIYLPQDIVNFLKRPGVISSIRNLIAAAPRPPSHLP